MKRLDLLPLEERGKMILITGAPNLGKSSQVELLYRHLSALGLSVVYIKYPLYDFSITGPLAFEILQRSQTYNRTPDELNKLLQKLAVRNRREFEPLLIKMLNQGQIVLMEDYIITGLVWGEISGVNRNYLLHINKNLLQVDLGITLYGERITSAVNNDHKFESMPAERWNTAQELYLEHSRSLGYTIVKVTQGVEHIAQTQTNIQELVNKFLKLSVEA